MPARFRARLTYANVMATIAVFIALGGGAYAASKLPPNSVGTKQIKDGAVKPKKVAASTIALFKGQRGNTGAQGLQGVKGDSGPAGHNGTDATIDGVAAGGALTGSYPNPSIAAGAVGTAQFGTIPSVSAYNSVDESIPNAAETTLTFNTNEYDNDSIHSTTTNTSRLTAPIAGVYEIEGEVLWAANATGERVLVIKENGGTILSESRVAADPSFGTGQQVVTQAKLSAGDYVEFTVEQNSGPSLAASSAFRDPGGRMHWLGP